MPYLAAIIIGYLFGAIPAGYLICKKMTGLDPRKLESHRTGGGNVTRIAGKRAGYLTMVADGLKALSAVWFFARVFQADALTISIIILFVLIGNNWSPWSRGVSSVCNIGAMLAIWPQAGLTNIVVGLVVKKKTNTASKASLVNLILTMIEMGWFAVSHQEPAYLIYGFGQAIIIGFALRGNFASWRNGTERTLEPITNPALQGGEPS